LTTQRGGVSTAVTSATESRHNNQREGLRGIGSETMSAQSNVYVSGPDKTHSNTSGRVNPQNFDDSVRLTSKANRDRPHSNSKACGANSPMLAASQGSNAVDARTSSKDYRPYFDQDSLDNALPIEARLAAAADMTGDNSYCNEFNETQPGYAYAGSYAYGGNTGENTDAENPSSGGTPYGSNWYMENRNDAGSSTTSNENITPDQRTALGGSSGHSYSSSSSSGVQAGSSPHIYSSLRLCKHSTPVAGIAGRGTRVPVNHEPGTPPSLIKSGPSDGTSSPIWKRKNSPGIINLSNGCLELILFIYFCLKYLYIFKAIHAAIDCYLRRS